jgi:hypothetical protein
MHGADAAEDLQDTAGVKVRRNALLSQEGSMIETAVEIVRGGVVPVPHSSRSILKHSI